MDKVSKMYILALTLGVIGFTLGVMSAIFSIISITDDNQPDYTIYAVDDCDVQQVDSFVIVPSGSIICPNDVKLQRPRYVFVEAEK